MKIALLVMPFHEVRLPCIGLTQIKGRLKQVFGVKIQLDIYYINHDFYEYFGHDMYEWIRLQPVASGLGEWLFRQDAFDNIENNMKSYIERFYARQTREFDTGNIRKIMLLGNFIRGVINRHQLASYNLVGINATFNTLPGLAFCRHLKKIDQTIITVMGGASLHLEPGETLSRYYPYIDYICSGSGLVSFPRLLESLMNNDTNVSIPGIFPGGIGNNAGKLSEELDINCDIELDYDDFFESFYQFNLEKHHQPTITLETSRGCWWNRCEFCSLNDTRKQYSIKQSEKAIKEINHYLEKYKCGIEMVDNIMPRSYIKKVLPFIENPGDFSIIYETRADYNREEMEQLRQAGITCIQPGIESLCTDIHEVMNKGVNAFQCINMLKLCVRFKIFPFWNLMLGFPGMTESMYKNLLDTLDRVSHLPPPFGASLVRFGRSSIYWCEKEKYHLNLQPAAFYQYLYPYGAEFLDNMAFYFDDINYSSPRFRLLSEYFPQFMQQVGNWKITWQNYKKNTYPKLYCFHRDNTPYIFDSRQSNRQVYPISPMEEKILTVLEEPMTINSIQDTLPGETPENITAALAHLESKQLLFKEKDRTMNLVIQDYSDIPLK